MIMFETIENYSITAFPLTRQSCFLFNDNKKRQKEKKKNRNFKLQICLEKYALNDHHTINVNFFLVPNGETSLASLKWL